MQWVMKKRSYWEFGELLNAGVKTLIYATDPQGYKVPVGRILAQIAQSESSVEVGGWRLKAGHWRV